MIQNDHKGILISGDCKKWCNSIADCKFAMAKKIEYSYHCRIQDKANDVMKFLQDFDRIYCNGWTIFFAIF